MYWLEPDDRTLEGKDMTRRTSATIAGSAYLLYIAIGVTQMVMGKATQATSIPARLALIAEHAASERIDILLTLLTGFIAIALAVSLYGITRDEDNEIAVFGLACRVGEGVVGGFPVTGLGLLWLATLSTASNPLDSASASALAVFLIQLGAWKFAITATLFAVGSTAFCWLLLRGRMIPRLLAWLGVVASVILVIALPLRLVGALDGAIVQLVWLPMAAFEIPVGIWLIVKGVAPPLRERQ